MPIAPVEVETQVEKYQDKLEAVFKYFKAFNCAEFGILYLTNLIKGKENKEKKYQHNWETIIDLINKEKLDSRKIILISAIKKRSEKDKYQNYHQLYRSDYSQWEIYQIDCKIFYWNGETVVSNSIQLYKE